MADEERLHALNRELLESPGLDLVRTRFSSGQRSLQFRAV